MQYKLITDSTWIKRTDENGGIVFIPADPRNSDWQAYQAWLALGNTPEAAE